MMNLPSHKLVVPAFMGLLLVSALCLAVVMAYAQPTGSNTNAPNVMPAVKFAQLPSAPATGAVFYMTDGLSSNCGDSACTGYGTTVTGGGGALKLLIWFNAVNWTTIGK